MTYLFTPVNQTLSFRPSASLWIDPRSFVHPLRTSERRATQQHIDKSRNLTFLGKLKVNGLTWRLAAGRARLGPRRGSASTPADRGGFSGGARRRKTAFQVSRKMLPKSGGDECRPASAGEMALLWLRGGGGSSLQTSERQARLSARRGGCSCSHGHEMAVWHGAAHRGTARPRWWR